MGRCAGRAGRGEGAAASGGRATTTETGGCFSRHSPAPWAGPCRARRVPPPPQDRGPGARPAPTRRSGCSYPRGARGAKPTRPPTPANCEPGRTPGEHSPRNPAKRPAPAIFRAAGAPVAPPPAPPALWAAWRGAFNGARPVGRAVRFLTPGGARGRGIYAPRGAVRRRGATGGQGGMPAPFRMR